MEQAYSYNDILLVPDYSEITTRKDVDLSVQLTPKIKLALPIISSNMDTVTEYKMAITMALNGGLGIIHRYCTISSQTEMVMIVKKHQTTLPYSTLDSKGRLAVGAAVGVNDGYMKRVDSLIKAGVDVLCVDIAHGHHKLAGNAIKSIKLKYPEMCIIAGNVVTASGVKFLAESGADCVKVGIGPSSVCSTRTQTGNGYPQFSAVLECSKEAQTHGITIISDGGHTEEPGNMVKALSGGATACMLGRMLSGTTESPGDKIVKDNQMFKLFRGMASKEANASRGVEITTPEGISKLVPYKGGVKFLLDQIRGGLRSGLSYQGCSTVDELHRKDIRFCFITGAGRYETVTR